MIIIDLSSNNGPPGPLLDAAKAKGVRGAIFKISEGITFHDPVAREGIAHARLLGMKVGGYHFCRPDNGNSPQAEAANFVATAKKCGLWRRGDIRPVLDFETRHPTRHESAWRDAFYDSVLRLVGIHSILYTSPGFNHWIQAKRLQRALWVAHYGVKKPDPVTGYGKPWLWQFTDLYVLGGRHVDANQVMGAVPAATLARNCVARTPARPRPPRPPRPPVRPPGLPSWLPDKYAGMWLAPWTTKAARHRPFHVLLWKHGYCSPHFTLAEWACHDRNKTRPSNKLRSNVQRHAFALERFRHELGDVPVPLGSAFRTEAYNRQVGGASQSRHVKGDATDLFKAWVDHVGRGKALQAAEKVWARGGVGNETSGTLHVDSRGWRARFVTWVRS
jgi:GH25 family lysozyme M1 (1,4-beta-N-acetylmuramidase)